MSESDRMDTVLDRLLEEHGPFRTLVEDVQDFITVVDLDKTIRYINHPVAGLEFSDVIGRPVLEFVDPDDHDAVLTAMEQVVSAGGTTTYMSQARGPDGTMAWYENRLSPLKENGEVVGVVFAATDRTRERQALEELDHERDFMRQSLDVIDATIVALDSQGAITLLNRVGGQLLDIDPESAVGQDWFEHYIPDAESERTREEFAKLMRGEVEAAEYFINDVVSSTGETRSVSWHNTLLLDDEGNITGTLSYGDDVTELQKTEKALVDRDVFLDSVFKTSPAGIGITRERVLLEVNERLCEMVGYDASEMVGQSARMLYQTQEEYEWVGRIKYGQIAEKGTGTVETRFLRKDGDLIDVLLSSAPMDDATEDGPGRVTFAALDITDRMRATRKLLEERAFTETLVDAMQDTFFVFEMETGRPLRWNSAFETISGYSTTDIARMKAPDDFYDRVSLDRLGQAMSKLTSFGEVTIEADLQTRSGSSIPYEYRAVVIRDAHDQPYAVCALGRDITDRKQVEDGLRDEGERLEREVESRTTELVMTNEQLRTAYRAKSDFLAAMSHELRTPLNSIIGFTGVMYDGLAGPVTDEQRKQLEMVRNSGQHLLGLVNDILDLSRIESGKLDVVQSDSSVREVVDSAVELIRLSARDKGLDFDVEVEDGPLHTDSRALVQILLNLLSNAVKFTTEGSVRLTGRVDEDGFALFTVSDTGIGMDPERLGTIFEAFRRIGRPVDDSPPGTGLGMAISWRLVNRLGGRIDVESELGEGSTFRVTVPARFTGPSETG